MVINQHMYISFKLWCIWFKRKSFKADKTQLNI
jgi:hypothetical protein